MSINENEIVKRQDKLNSFYKSISAMVSLIEVYRGSGGNSSLVTINNLNKSLLNRIDILQDGSPGCDELSQSEFDSLVIVCAKLEAALTSFLNELKENIAHSLVSTYMTESTAIDSVRKYVAEFIELTEGMANVARSLSSKKSLYEKIDDLEKRINATSEKAAEILHTHLPNKINEGLNEIKENAEIRETITTAAISEIEQLKNAEKKTSEAWLERAAILAFTTFFFILFGVKFNILDFLVEDSLHSPFNENIQLALLSKEIFKSIFLISFMVGLTFLCMRQYSSHKKNFALYSHKLFSIRAFNAFINVSTLSTSRAEIVEKAMDAIFRSPDFLDHRSGKSLEADLESKIVRTIRSTLSDNKE
ncbi:MAG: hypothetical protein ACK4PK_03665 [Alphaproteobacteria bacterium]